MGKFGEADLEREREGELSSYLMDLVVVLVVDLVVDLVVFDVPFLRGIRIKYGKDLNKYERGNL